jgi:hypothetical protein
VAEWLVYLWSLSAIFWNEKPGTYQDKVYFATTDARLVALDAGAQKMVFTIGKAGILWKLDRRTGKFLGHKETVFLNLFDRIDPQTGEVHYRNEIIEQPGGTAANRRFFECPAPTGTSASLPLTIVATMKEMWSIKQRAPFLTAVLPGWKAIHGGDDGARGGSPREAPGTIASDIIIRRAETRLRVRAARRK